MSCEFGNIEYVDVIGAEIRITGHKWVALALDHDDAFTVTRLLKVEPKDIRREQIEALKHASDVYDCSLVYHEHGLTVRFLINGETSVTFTCEKMLKEYRYYSLAELREIFQWLSAKSTPVELRKYLEEVKNHGFIVKLTDGGAEVTESDSR